MKLKDEFIHGSDSPHDYPYKLGKYIASPLSGFIAGAAFASIIWFVGIYLLKLFFPNTI